jgi:hypothetical protein
MGTFKPSTRRVLIALVGGILLDGLYKLYLYTNDREQYNDSNLLVSTVMVLIAAGVIYVVLQLASTRNASK